MVLPGKSAAHGAALGEITMVEWRQWEGRIIDGKFHLGRYLGGSPHSAVFLTALGERAPQTVIKLVPADSAAAQVWMLRRELAAGLSHPGLLPLFHFGTCQVDASGCVYAVMERSEEDLSQVIPTRPLAPPEAREMVSAVIESLAYLHAQGFVHGSLTPANIMAAGDRIKISSDGILRIGESSANLWESHPNAPPEARAGLTPAGDVWSVGMTVVEVLTQQAPVWDRAAGDPAVPASLEPPFLEIARRCLRSDPQSRCSLEEIDRALRPAAPASPSGAVTRARAGAAPAAPAPQPIVPQAARQSRSLVAVAAAVLGVLLVAAGILAAVRLWNSPRAAAPPQPSPAGQAVPASVETPPKSAPPAESAPSAVETAPAPTPPPEPAPPPSIAAGSAPLSRLEVADRALPEVPPQILATIRGAVKVSVRVTVDPSGAVVDASLASHPGSKYFDRVSLDAARRWKFQPASAPGDAASTGQVRFEYRPNGCTAAFAPAPP